MNSDYTHVYLMPGMAANPTIFEYIKLPKDKYKIHWLEWQIPDKYETLQNYAKRMCKFIKEDNVVLLGVSFGGILVQEMSKYLKLKNCLLYLVLSLIMSYLNV